MKAIVCRAYGPPKDLVTADMPEPQAGPGQIVIDVYAAGVNFPDVLLVQGLYQVKPPLPFSPVSRSPASSRRSARACASRASATASPPA